MSGEFHFPPVDDFLAAYRLQPDRVFYVPTTFGEEEWVFTSKDSAYYYREPVNRYVVDIKMGTTSNTDPVEGQLQNPHGRMQLFVVPWDVPGSYLPGGYWASGIRFALKDDLDRYRLIWTVHLAHEGEGFIKIGGATLKSGTWIGGHSPPYGEPQTGNLIVEKSLKGYDTYRFTMGCLMRGVPQQVALTFRHVDPY